MLTPTHSPSNEITSTSTTHTHSVHRHRSFQSHFFFLGQTVQHSNNNNNNHHHHLGELYEIIAFPSTRNSAQSKMHLFDVNMFFNRNIRSVWLSVVDGAVNISARCCSVHSEIKSEERERAERNV